MATPICSSSPPASYLHLDSPLSRSSLSFQIIVPHGLSAETLSADGPSQEQFETILKCFIELCKSPKRKQEGDELVKVSLWKYWFDELQRTGHSSQTEFKLATSIYELLLVLHTLYPSLSALLKICQERYDGLPPWLIREFVKACPGCAARCQVTEGTLASAEASRLMQRRRSEAEAPQIAGNIEPLTGPIRNTAPSSRVIRANPMNTPITPSSSTDPADEGPPRMRRRAMTISHTRSSKNEQRAVKVKHVRHRREPAEHEPSLFAQPIIVNARHPPLMHQGISAPEVPRCPLAVQAAQRERLDPCDIRFVAMDIDDKRTMDIDDERPMDIESTFILGQTTREGGTGGCIRQQVRSQAQAHDVPSTHQPLHPYVVTPQDSQIRQNNSLGLYFSASPSPSPIPAVRGSINTPLAYTTPSKPISMPFRIPQGQDPVQSTPGLDDPSTHIPLRSSALPKPISAPLCSNQPTPTLRHTMPQMDRSGGTSSNSRRLVRGVERMKISPSASTPVAPFCEECPAPSPDLRAVGFCLQVQQQQQQYGSPSQHHRVPKENNPSSSPVIQGSPLPRSPSTRPSRSSYGASQPVMHHVLDGLKHGGPGREPSVIMSSSEGGREHRMAEFTNEMAVAHALLDLEGSEHQSPPRLVASDPAPTMVQLPSLDEMYPRKTPSPPPLPSNRREVATPSLKGQLPLVSARPPGVKSPIHEFNNMVDVMKFNGIAPTPPLSSSSSFSLSRSSAPEMKRRKDLTVRFSSPSKAREGTPGSPGMGLNARRRGNTIVRRDSGEVL